MPGRRNSVFHAGAHQLASGSIPEDTCTAGVVVQNRHRDSMGSNEMLRTWLYVSTSTLGANSDDEIASICSVAGRRNPQLGLTGALIFSGGHFAQLLEGPSGAVEAMKASICSDDRHRDICTLPILTLDQRRYGRWALAYSGRATVIDSVLAQAVRERDANELLNYMNRFAVDVT
jgi:Sensors of blue-light using FAD